MRTHEYICGIRISFVDLCYIMKSGFTLIELLVAMSIFSIAIVSATSLFISAMRGQRNAIAQQNLIENTRFVLEHMSRQIRMAQRLDSAVALCPANVFFSDSGPTIRFIDYKGNCLEYRVSSNKIQMSSGGPFADLTSDDIRVSNLYFLVDGRLPNDVKQPRVTIYINADVPSVLPGGSSDIRLQTTVSARNLDVP